MALVSGDESGIVYKRRGLAVPLCCQLHTNPHSEVSGGPGSHQKPLELVDCFDLVTLRRLIDTLLEFGYLPFELFPGQRIPFIHRLSHVYDLIDSLRDVDQEPRLCAT